MRDRATVMFGPVLNFYLVATRQGKELDKHLVLFQSRPGFLLVATYVCHD